MEDAVSLDNLRRTILVREGVIYCQGRAWHAARTAVMQARTANTRASWQRVSLQMAAKMHNSTVLFYTSRHA